jgi:ClpP class serine protease
MFSNLVIKRILFVILSTVIAHSTTHFCNAQNSEESENQKTVVIPLVGKVGFVFGLDAPESKWFNAELIEELLKKAKKDRDNVTKIIFEIDSPGGYVSEERLICDLIQKYREEFEIVAYPHNAFSAACTIVMTCDRLVVSSDTNIGGAVILSGDGTALEDGNAADKKMASIDAVQVRTFYENANRPGVLADAFGIVKAELWFNNDSYHC